MPSDGEPAPVERNDDTLDVEALIDIQSLQELFSAFHAATGMAATIVAPDGRILAGAGWQKLCVEFHRKNPDSEQLCIESDIGRREALSKDGEAVYRCPHGLMDAAVPILINGRHLANLFAGQFLLAPLDATLMAEFKARASGYGFDEEAYMAALEAVPIITEKQVFRTLRYLRGLALMIGESGMRQLRLETREQALAAARERLEATARRRAEEARWLGQTIAANPIPTFIIDAHCKVTQWNRACELLTQIPAAEIVGTDRHREAFYPQRRRIMADLIVENASIHEVAMLYGKKYHSAPFFEGGYEGEDFFPHLGKRGKWLLFTAAPLHDGGGRVIGAIETIQDITARRMAEQELRASEARYRQLFESANDTILIIKNGIIVDCNREALNLTGVSRKALIGSTPLDFSPRTQPDGTLSKTVLMEKTAIAFQDLPQLFEWRLTGKDGVPIDVEVSLTRFKIGDDPHGLAIIRDITGRKKMVRELEAREAELNEKTRYLEKVNQALKASLDHREIERRSVEEHLLLNLKRFVFPYLEELKNCRLDTDAKAYLSIIGNHLDELTTQAARTLSAKYLDFTPTEIRVADFIRTGKSSKEIAALLNLSPSSVQWHRKNIREKLGLTNKKVNLTTYLASLTD